MEEQVPQNVWDAVEAFLKFGSVDAGVFLRDLLHQATYTESITRRNIFSIMLTNALSLFHKGSMPASTLLLVAILNRLFCMEAIPDAMARPINDGRPKNIEDLLLFYVNALSFPQLPISVVDQLYLCVSSLLLLQPEMNFIDMLLKIFGGTVPEMTDDTRRFMKLLSCVMNVLNDRRVSIGPVRRSTQRVIMQRNMHFLLTSMLEKDLNEQALVVTQGVTFLTECSVLDSQNISRLFWNQLPSSSFWQMSLERLRQGTASEAVVEAICAVLRIIVDIDADAVTLLSMALENVLGDRAQAPMLHICRVITSALESSLEFVVVQFGPDHPIHQALASGAQLLQRVLIEQAAMTNLSSTSDIVLVVCEGFSVLAQVLTPLAIPDMEETDDPDDYAVIVDDIQQKNQQKKEALLRLDEFIKSCQIALLEWLGLLSASDVKSIALYMCQNEDDEFEVWHDELPVALVTTYERLCKLLPLSEDDRVRDMVAQGYLTVALWNSHLSYMALLNYSDALLRQKQAPLIPVVVRRYQIEWEAEHKERVVSILLTLLRSSIMMFGDIFSAASITEALRELHAPLSPCMVQNLWQGLHLPCGNDKTPQWILASSLASIMEQWDITLPSGVLDTSQLDDYILTELRSCTLRSLNDIWCVMELLQRLEPDAAQCLRAAERIAKWVEATLTAGSQEQDQYIRAIRQWCAARTLHFSVTWRLVRPLDLTTAAGILVDALETFITHKLEAGIMDWGKEREYFSPYVLDTIAQSPFVSRLQLLLISFFESGKYISDNGTFFRICAAVRGGIALFQANSCSPILTFRLFCAVAKEYINLRQGLSSMLSHLDINDMELLQDLAKFGRIARMVAVELPSDAPKWLHDVCNAMDEFEIQRILRG